MKDLVSPDDLMLEFLSLAERLTREGSSSSDVVQAMMFVGVSLLREQKLPDHIVGLLFEVFKGLSRSTDNPVWERLRARVSSEVNN